MSARNQGRAKRISRACAEIGSSCPYTLLAKRVIRLLKGDPLVERNPSDGMDRRLLDRIRTGRSIALIGVFCPIFWFSLLSGASAKTVGVNAVHSGVVILIGLVLMGKARSELYRRNRRR